ncbi:MAG: PTS sugar transporter subunit IIA [Desulfobacterales bacterium]|nr:PTS sugar transporter subunit IIA [Desulfobacterales bacterium]
MTQLARCLDLSPSTIERWVSQGRIPVHISNKDCIFNPSALGKWSAAHKVKFTPPQALQGEPVIEPVETLIGAMGRGGVFKNIEGDSIASILQAAVNRLTGIPEKSKEDLFQKLLEREQLTSTGIGKGVAIPHPRSPIAAIEHKSMIATCFLKTPVDFNAVDGKPVFALFVLISQTVQQHLHLLSRLSFCIRNDAFISFLKTRPAPEALFPKITELEIEMDRTNR